tara:strand:+ start:457 stop:852 length:396 start_codon:yes stop_codon:yes gene_type:complete
MATEILINDGGAPARILPFMAASAVTAGNCVNIDSAGKVVPAHTTLLEGFKESILGYALTTVSANELCSVITGKGVMLKALCGATMTTGKGGHIGATPGQLALNVVLGEPIALVSTDPDAGSLGLKTIVTI